MGLKERKGKGREEVQIKIRNKYQTYEIFKMDRREDLSSKMKRLAEKQFRSNFFLLFLLKSPKNIFSQNMI